jgi:type IV secretion system protein VirB1
MIGLELLMACAPDVAPSTMAAIIGVESRGHPLAIHVNRGALPRAAVDASDAAKLARAAIDAGYSVDLGLMQVNSRNLPKLGYTVEQMFEPCTNLQAGAEILSASYRAAAQRHGEGQDALRAALSAYNTGNFQNGFRNGYVAKYYGRQAVTLPALSTFPVRRPPAPGVSTARAPNPYTAETTVFSLTRSPLP